MDKFPFIDASDRAKAPTRSQIGLEKYPWRDLPVNKSFYIDTNIDPVKLATIQSSASRWSKKLGRKFKVVQWENGIEVARLPDDRMTVDAKTAEEISKLLK